MKRDGDRAKQRCDGDITFPLFLSLSTFAFVFVSRLLLSLRIDDTRLTMKEIIDKEDEEEEEMYKKIL